MLRSRGAGCAAYATRSGRRSTHLRSRARLRSLAQISNAVVKQPDLDEEALRLQVQGKNLVVVRQTMADSVQPVSVTSPSSSRS